MPQDSRLGPTFLLLTDDLQTDCLILKYVDDTTLTEILQDQNEFSNMQKFFHQLLSWSYANDMIVNFTKTKEMIMGPPAVSTNLSMLVCRGPD